MGSDECVDENAKVQALCGQQCSDLKSDCGNNRLWCKQSRKEVNVAEFCPKTCGKFCGTGDNNKGVFELCGENCPALKDKCSKTRHYCAKGKREIHVKEFCPATCGIVTTPPPMDDETPCVDKNAEVQKLCGQQCSDLKSDCGNNRLWCKQSRKEVNVAEFCPKTCGKFCGTGDNNKFAFD